MEKEESRKVKEAVELYKMSVPFPRTEEHERDWKEMTDEERKEWIDRVQ